jgi:hypothetical protein
MGADQEITRRWFVFAGRLPQSCERDRKFRARNLYNWALSAFGGLQLVNFDAPQPNFSGENEFFLLSLDCIAGMV